MYIYIHIYIYTYTLYSPVAHTGLLITQTSYCTYAPTYYIITQIKTRLVRELIFFLHHELSKNYFTRRLTI